MERLEFMVDGRECRLTVVRRADVGPDGPAGAVGTVGAAGPAPDALLIEPIDRRDLDFLDREVDYLREHAGRSFALATFIVEDWNSELSPWKADPVFGKEAFGDGAGKTLRFIEEALVPEVRRRLCGLGQALTSEIRERRPGVGGPGETVSGEVILGGYSLAALFALWAGYESSRFNGIAAASPSVWFPGWLDYARARRPLSERIYLSLGDAEPRTRNRIMATVGDCIREMDALMADCPHTLEWNPGNHFQDADLRTAKAFLWCLEHHRAIR